jgi:hypothetical protein
MEGKRSEPTARVPPPIAKTAELPAAWRTRMQIRSEMDRERAAMTEPIPKI